MFYSVYMMVNHQFQQLNPYGVNDLSDFDTLSVNHEEYYPFSPQNVIIDEKVVFFMLRLGYVFDHSTQGWFKLNFDGLYDPVSDDHIKTEIMRFLDKRAPSGVNIPLKCVDEIYNRLRACSYDRSCFRKFDDFLLNHPEYEIPYMFDGCDYIPDELIPVRNGVINPATMELLPHCAYLLHPIVYDFPYRKLSEDEILNGIERDVYSGIITDPETLDLFLWWVGMVLFSSDLPRILMVLYGIAGTGKSTLYLGLKKILTSNKSAMMNLSNYKNSRFMSGNFVDKKLVVFDEMSNANGLLDDSLFKQLTGGTSDFTIEEKYRQPRTVKLSSKFLLIGNNYPAFIQDTAIYERLFIVECDTHQDKIVRDLVVDDEYVNWLFNAAYYYYVIKHPHTYVKSLSELRTPKMLRDLDKYRNTDPFIFWIKDYLDLDDITVEDVQNGLNRHRTKEVFNDYQHSVLSDGGKPLSAPKFNQKLRTEYGLESKTLRGIDGTYKGYSVVKRG